MTPTTDELRVLVDRLEGATTDWNGERMVDGEPPLETLYCRDLREAAAALRQWIAERECAESIDQDGHSARMADEEYGGQAEGACLYDLYAENRQFASQEPPRRNKNGGWDYSV